MITLPRLPANYEKVPGLFPRYWDQAMGLIEKSVNDLLALPTIQAAIASANSAAAAANTAATSAANATAAQASENSLATSYIDGSSFVAPLIEADSLGAVTIKTHTRVYGDSTLNPSVSVTGATITTTAVVGETVRVFYDDSTRSGGAVTYYYTIDPAPSPAQSGITHSVGAVVIPSAGTAAGAFIQPIGFVFV